MEMARLLHSPCHADFLYVVSHVPSQMQAPCSHHSFATLICHHITVEGGACVCARASEESEVSVRLPYHIDTMLLRPSARTFLHQHHFRAASIFSHPIPGRKSHSNLSFASSRAAATGRESMSTAAATTHHSSSVVEHVVLFDVKPETGPEKVEAMLSGLRSLSSLEAVLYLTAGSIHRLRSSSLSFTHLLYGRYLTKQALADYSAHPSHVKVVQESVLPIARDVMAVDWVAEVDGGPAIPSATAAFRLTLVKPKPDLDEGSQKEIGQVLEGIRSSVPSALQVSFGENFSPARAKGFGWGLMSFFPGVDGIDAMDSDEDLVKAQKEKVKDLVDSVIVVDYEYIQPIPPLPPSL